MPLGWPSILPVLAHIVVTSSVTSPPLEQLAYSAKMNPTNLFASKPNAPPYGQRKPKSGFHRDRNEQPRDHAECEQGKDVFHVTLLFGEEHSLHVGGLRISPPNEASSGPRLESRPHT
jgi:hypothetical protein